MSSGSRSDVRSLWPGPGGRAWVVAHRGDSAHAPENTLIAALRAWEAGADAWELDVQITRDGVPVVLHDESLARTTDVARRHGGDPRADRGYLVADFGWEEIRRLDAGSWFVDPAGGHRSAAYFGTLDDLGPGDRGEFRSGRVGVPRLADALDLTRRLGWAVNVEIKALPLDDPRRVAAVLVAIDEAGAEGRVWISSFDHRDLIRVRDVRPDWPTAALVTSPTARPLRYVRDLVGAAAYHPSVAAVGGESIAYRRTGAVSALRVDDLRALADGGLRTFVYTVNQPSLFAHLAEAGVSGIFTDRPTAFLPASRRRGPSTPDRAEWPLP